MCSSLKFKLSAYCFSLVWFDNLANYLEAPSIRRWDLVFLPNSSPLKVIVLVLGFALTDDEGRGRDAEQV